jgi:AAA15 family ATPase/GTPase
MLLRFTVENVFSFGKRKEFNLFPYTRLNTLKHHCYERLDIKVLKVAALYGANGAGKSNLVKAIGWLQNVVYGGSLPTSLRHSGFKLFVEGDEQPKSQMIAIEFIASGQAFYYGLEWKEGIILTEELYHSGLGKKEDKLLFERKTNEKRHTTVKLAENIEQDQKGRLLKEILVEEFAEPDKSVFKWLAARESTLFIPIKQAQYWFEGNLRVLSPNTKPHAIMLQLERNKSFKKYADDTMRTFKTGIDSLETKTIPFDKFFGEEEERFLEEIRQQFAENPHAVIELEGDDEMVITKEEDAILVKYLETSHSKINGSKVIFDIEQESDGTRRLIDFLPMLYETMTHDAVFFIDEIERSIHPLLIKELVRKFADNPNTKGQLIFTTHESNLLDQQIFRQDEIWFAEKDQEGSTDLYTLSDFKEHKTIDIQKGYLNGRYGSIPFLGDLKALNWEEYVGS